MISVMCTSTNHFIISLWKLYKLHSMEYNSVRKLNINDYLFQSKGRFVGPFSVAIIGWVQALTLICILMRHIYANI